MQKLFDLLLNRRRLLADKDLLGRWGERHCEKFLKSKGLQKLTRNFSCSAGEIDLIMVDFDGTIVFVEVKTRANEDFSPAESVVTLPKRDRMYLTARHFLKAYKIEDRPCRFDVVTVVLGEKGPVQIRHYESAFTESK